MAAISGIWTLIAFRIIRSFNHGIDLQSGARIPFGGKVSDVIKTGYQKPGEFWDYVRSEERPWYLWQMLIPTGFMFVFEPSVILIAAPVLAWNILSTFGYQHLIGYHYVAQIIPIHRDRNRLGHRAPEDGPPPADGGRPGPGALAVDRVPLGSVLVGAQQGARPLVARRIPVVAQTNDILKDLPDDAVVSAYHSIVPHMDHRKRIYMWPVPWRAAYWGQLNQEGQTLPFTDEIEYLVLPTQLLPDDQKIFDTFSDEFEVVKQNESTTLYRRKGTT